MADQIYYTLLTARGFAAVTNALALKQTIDITHMAVGDGNGAAVIPTDTQASLVRETYRAPLNQLTRPSDSQIMAELVIPATEGGYTIRELGLYDAAGQLLAVANFPPTYKPTQAEGTTSDLVIRLVVNVGNASVVNITLDPSAVIATRGWVMANFTAQQVLPGGATGQVPTKISDVDGAIVWRTLGVSDIDGLAAALDGVQLPVTHDATNVAPIDGAHGVVAAPELTGAAYYPLYTVPQAQRHFAVIAAGGDWAAPVYAGTSQPASGVPAIAHTLATTLALDANFQWRYRDETLAGEFGPWSTPTAFGTSAVYVAAPTITGPADGTVDVSERPVIQLSAFATVGGADTQAATSVRIRDAVGAVVWELLDSSDPLDNIVVPAGVLHDGASVYTIEARHHGTAFGASQWSAPVTITTLVEFIPDFAANIGMAYGGGFIVGKIKSDADGKTYGLIVARQGYNPLSRWPDVPQDLSPKIATGSAPTFLSDGKANTDYLVERAGFTVGNLNAGTGYNGYKDWYLPARAELNLIYRAFKPNTSQNVVGNRSASGFVEGTLPYGTNTYAVPPLGPHTAVDPPITPVLIFRGAGYYGFYSGSDYGFWSSTMASSGTSSDKDTRLSDTRFWTENFQNGGQGVTQASVSDCWCYVRRVLLPEG